MRPSFAGSVLSLLLAAPALAQRLCEPPQVTARTAFAIVVDSGTWRAIPAAVRAYRDAVEADGLATWILVDDWRTPEAVRDALRARYEAGPRIEGAILVGRIPIVMVRGAQHLTTAFKMDEQRYGWERSSIPSDRFYEDFDLLLTPLDGAATKRPELHYYRLAPESAQRIEKEIYTARLLPAAGDAAAFHAAIETCLRRFADRDRTAPRLDHVLTLMGHGYVTESLDAWSDERAMLTELAPELSRPGANLIALHHSLDADLEPTLLRELAEPTLDLAVLHSHGHQDRQYLTGAPPLPSATSQVEALRRYLRGRLRDARERGRSEEEEQQKWRERWQLPDAWFAGAFDEAITAADEAVEAPKELEAAEVAGIPCGAEVVELDSCFNGAYIEPVYQAGAYLFGAGTTQAVVANSVNVAQDVWGERSLGVLTTGGRVGAWHRLRPHLESHLFGDPTFRFAPRAGDDAVLRQLALRGLPATRDRAATLLATLRADPAAIVRLEALGLLARDRGPALREALPIAAADPNSLVRRVACSLMGDVDGAAFLAPLVHAALRDPCPRVGYAARDGLAKYDPTAVGAAFDAALARLPTPYAGDAATMRRRLQTSAGIADYLTEAQDRALEAKKRLNAVRTFRLYRLHAAVPVLLALAGQADEDEAVRTAAAEALGWFGYSSRRDEIARAMQGLADDDGAPAGLRDEARKTIRRLATGANDPLLP